MNLHTTNNEEPEEKSSGTPYFEREEEMCAPAPQMEQKRVKTTRTKKKRGFALGFLWGIFASLLVVGVAGLIFYAGNSKNTAIDDAVISKLQTLEGVIHQHYKDEVSDQQLCDGLYKGLLDSLGDPYSCYYTPEELRDLLESTEGVYYGIGAYVSMDVTNFPKISSVIAGTPAEEAGIRDNDILYKVDGVSTQGMSLEEAVSLIKGEEHTMVNLTIVRDGQELEIAVERRKVETPTVNHEMMDNGMGYIQIVEFDEVTPGQFQYALEDLRTQGMKGLALDLRGNPGGSMDAVVQIAQMMLPEGLIVYTEDKYGKQRGYACDGKNQLDIPLVVLVDMNSASAAEILAGAIKDYGIGTLVGTKTFGKGIVQQIIPLQDNSAIKLTVSSYYTPKGENIHGIGISPDVEVPFDSKAYYDVENPYDNQLEKAKEVLQDLMK